MPQLAERLKKKKKGPRSSPLRLRTGRPWRYVDILSVSQGHGMSLVSWHLMSQQCSPKNSNSFSKGGISLPMEDSRKAERQLDCKAALRLLLACFWTCVQPWRSGLCSLEVRILTTQRNSWSGGLLTLVICWEPYAYHFCDTFNIPPN